MGKKYSIWERNCDTVPNSPKQVAELILSSRAFTPVEKLEYGDYGLDRAVEAVSRALKDKKRIALYADYDVDGTMSCVSWIWFFKALGFENFIHYIPCRFKEGYGVNLNAVKHLIENERAQLIITMDTGITANAEAQYCKERGVEFLCTDHHKIQADKMPDCIVLNPKMHPDPIFQELCGCGITFVLLRKLSETFPVPQALWTDLLALVGMATICDVVPLNPVNHRLARKGVEGLLRSQRDVLKKLLIAASATGNADEKDVGFRLGPRINAVGRLGHADQVVEAFVSESPQELISHMGRCNEERKLIQKRIVAEATKKVAEHAGDSILFLGAETWHPGVVGIAASKIAEAAWKPTWLFQKKDGKGKGSARSVPGFDVTECMQACGDLFIKFGGHRAAGGFYFDLSHEEEIRKRLNSFALEKRRQDPDLWKSRTAYECELPIALLDLELLDGLDDLKPFGHGFEEPRFLLRTPLMGLDFYKDKTTGEPRHTVFQIKGANGRMQKVLFFHEIWPDLDKAKTYEFLVTVGRNNFQGRSEVSLYGVDWNVVT